MEISPTYLIGKVLVGCGSLQRSRSADFRRSTTDIGPSIRYLAHDIKRMFRAVHEVNNKEITLFCLVLEAL